MEQESKETFKLAFVFFINGIFFDDRKAEVQK